MQIKETAVIGSKQKGIKSKPLQAAKGHCEMLDLSKLPKYICYRAADLRVQLSLRYMLLLTIVAFGIYASIREYSFWKFMQRYRLKEYILAPGVMDFTPASPQTVSESYVSDAVSEFLSLLGNVNPSSIDEHYRTLIRFMSSELQTKFRMDTNDWLQQVKESDISQIFKIKQKQIKTDDKGRYLVTALARAEFYAKNNYLGYEDQVVEMQLVLVPPKQGQRWFLQMDKLGWTKVEDFRIKTDMQKGGAKKD